MYKTEFDIRQWRLAQYPTPTTHRQHNKTQPHNIPNHMAEIFFIIFIILFEYKKFNDNFSRIMIV